MSHSLSNLRIDTATPVAAEAPGAGAVTALRQTACVTRTDPAKSHRIAQRRGSHRPPSREAAQ